MPKREKEAIMTLATVKHMLNAYSNKELADMLNIHRSKLDRRLKKTEENK